MGVMTLFVAGCGRAEKPAEPPRESPASYMNDKAFRKEVADAHKEAQAIAAERQPLVDRMQQLVRQHGEDPGKLQNVPEWVELHRKVTELNAKYEAIRKRQLSTVRDRIAPARSK